MPKPQSPLGCLSTHTIPNVRTAHHRHYELNFFRHIVEDISPVVEYGSPTITKKLRLVHDLMRNYKKVVYDRLSSIPADETEPTDTMMYSFHDPQPFLWLKTRYAYLIWDDLTGRSVYVVLHPFLRTLTVSTLLFFPLVALFSAFSFQLHWSRPSMWCQQFWSSK